MTTAEKNGAAVKNDAAPQQNEGKTYEISIGGKTRKVSEQELLEAAKFGFFALDVIGSGQLSEGKTAGGDDGEMERFVSRYPDVSEFPPEVEKRIRGGDSPLDAYREYEIEKLKAQVDALEKNDVNRKKSTGSAGSDAGEDELKELESIFDSMFAR